MRHVERFPSPFMMDCVGKTCTARLREDGMVLVSNRVLFPHIDGWIFQPDRTNDDDVAVLAALKDGGEVNGRLVMPGGRVTFMLLPEPAPSPAMRL